MLTEIVSPKEVVFSENIEFIIIPAEEGDIGVLKNHTPIITNLKPGLIYIYKNKVIYKQFFISSGICEITQETCIILTEEIEDINEINIQEIKNSLNQNGENDLLKNKLKVLEEKHYTNNIL